jgi:hypothetical protein
MIPINKSRFAHGYEPQKCFPSSRNPFHWDEIEAYFHMHPLYSAMIRLAKARILQALLDLISKDESIRNTSFAWVFSDTSDFRAFCSDAGFSYKIVRQRAKQIATDGLIWRRPAGEGPRFTRERTK